MAHKALQDKDMVQKKTPAMVKNKRIFGRYEDVIESFGDDAGEELELDSADKLIPLTSSFRLEALRAQRSTATKPSASITEPRLGWLNISGMLR